MNVDIKVLVVDDSIVSRRLIRVYLKKMGITNVVEASNVKSAIENLKTETVDLILSDWSMPGMSGLNFLQFIRSDKHLKKIPFVMITAEGLKGSMAQALEEGVTKYVLKPYTYENIQNTIRSIYNKK